MTNPTATAAPRATKARTAVPSAAPAAPAAPADDWRDLGRTAIESLWNFLYAAVELDVYGDAHELADISYERLCDVKDGANEDFVWSEPQHLNYELRRILVLLRSAVALAGSSEAKLQSSLAQHAALIDQSAGWLSCMCEVVDRLPGPLDEMRDLGSLKTLLPFPSRKEVVRDTLNGFTLAQCELSLETIAAKASSVSAILSVLGERWYDEESRHEVGVSIDLVKIAVESIGAVADSMGKGSICGDMYYWMVGPSFQEAGKAVQA